MSLAKLATEARADPGLDGVAFRYPDSSSDALRDVSFTVPAGTMTALARSPDRDSRRGDRTSLVIAHRLSTIQRADQIVVLGEGRVLGVGDHESLSASNAAYQELARATAST